MIKNDITLWGKSGKDGYPIRYHLLFATPPATNHRYWAKVVTNSRKEVVATEVTTDDKTDITGWTPITTTDWRQELYL
jgi:hypothetical protein